MTEEMGKTRYLDLMNFESPEQAYEEVKKLASDLNDKEHLIRSCLFDLHAAVEQELRRIVYHTFYSQLFLTGEKDSDEKVTARFETMIRRLGFMDMFRILQPVLLSWPYPDFDCIQAINDARNQAAHGSSIERVQYKGRNPFKDADCFAQIYFDVWAMKQSVAKFFDRVIEGPKVQLRRYVSKYGSGEL